MKCKQCSDVSTLAQKYSSVLKKTAVNLERVTHESYIKLISWVALYITFLQSYLPGTKKFNVFLIEKDNLLVTVIKSVIDHVITDNCIDERHHDENKFLKKFGKIISGKVPNFERTKPLRSWVNEEARNITKVNVTSK